MSIRNSQKLKQLQSRKTKLEVDLKGLGKEVKDKQQAQSKAFNQLNSVKREIELLKTTDIVVSEHAILRYLERTMGLDLEQVKSQILTTDNIILIKNMGNGKYPVGNGSGLKLVVKQNTVVSVVQ